MSRLNLDTSVGGNNNRYSFMETPLEMSPPTQLPDRSPPPASSEPIAEESTQQNAWSHSKSEKERQFQQGMIPDYANCPPIEQHPANYAPLANVPVQHNNTPMSPYATSHGLQPHETPITTQYATAHGHQDYATQMASHSYSNQTLPQLPVSPQSYVTQSYTNIPDQQHRAMSPQAYANIPENQRHTPVPAQPYAYSHAQSQTTIPEEQTRGLEFSHQPYTYTEPPVSPPPPHSPGPLPLKERPDAPRSNTINIAPDENPLQSPKLSYFPPPTRAATAPEDLSAYHQPGQTTHPNQELTGGGWSNGLCELSSFGICCLGLICPCILYGRTQHRLSMKSRKEDPTNMLGYETCNGSCTGMGLLCGCQWLMATVQHTRTRKAYGIQGSIASDCVRATCCTCCTLIQDEKEVQKREELRARAARERGATLLSPYTTPGPMSYGRK